VAARITAVLNSYLRVTYLWEALESILRQESDLPLDVLLLSAVEGLSIPNELERVARERSHSVRIARVPRGPVGEGLRIAMREAQGTHLALLDDDDLWEPGKIRWIESQIAARPGLSYLHNGQTFVDAANRPVPAWNPHRLVRHPSSLQAPGHRLIVFPDEPESVNHGIGFSPDFNNSSVTIARSVLESSAEFLRQVRRGEDTFLYYCALGSGQPLALSSDRLTRYRIHATASTASTGGAAREDQMQNYLFFLDGHVESLQLIRERLGTRLHPEVLRCLDRDIVFWDLLRDITRRTVRPAEALSQLRCVVDGGRVRPRSRELFAVAWGTAAVISPEFTQRAFQRWRRVW
jgi:Glycosyltransferase like family 2